MESLGGGMAEAQSRMGHIAVPMGRCARHIYMWRALSRRDTGVPMGQSLSRDVIGRRHPRPAPSPVITRHDRARFGPLGWS